MNQVVSANTEISVVEVLFWRIPSNETAYKEIDSIVCIMKESDFLLFPHFQNAK